MKDFDKLCKIAEDLDPAEYTAVIAAKAADIVPALHALTGDAEQVEDMLTAFMLASVYADDKLDEAEYEMMRPMLQVLFGSGFNFDKAKEIAKELRPEGKELKEMVDRLVDMLGCFSDELKEDIIIVCLLICAVDGKVSAKEKKYIRKLMA